MSNRADADPIALLTRQRNDSVESFWARLVHPVILMQLDVATVTSRRHYRDSRIIVWQTDGLRCWSS